MIKGSASNKKKHSKNQQIISRHILISLIIYGLYVLYRVIYWWSSFHWLKMFVLLLTSTVFYLAFRSIKNSATPFEDEKGNINVLTDLNNVTGSVTEYFFDILYLQWFLLVVGLYTDYIWWLWLVIPIFAIYKLLSFGLPFLKGGGLPGMIPGMQQSAFDNLSHMNQQERKRHEKKKHKEELYEKRMRNVRQ
jgi:cation transport ATPase